MEQSQHNGESAENLIMSVLVRDLPMRLFHWLLVIISDYLFCKRRKLTMPMITGVNRGRLRGLTRQRLHWVGSADCGTGRNGCLFSWWVGHRPKTGPSARQAKLSR
ncbi:MAG: hypothetical protein PVI94_03525 [Desulfobacterales bacterium]